MSLRSGGLPRVRINLALLSREASPRSPFGEVAPCGQAAMTAWPTTGRFEEQPTQDGGGLDQPMGKPPRLPWSHYHGAVANPTDPHVRYSCRRARRAADLRPGRQAVESMAGACMKSLWMLRVASVIKCHVSCFYCTRALITCFRVVLVRRVISTWCASSCVVPRDAATRGVTISR